VYMGSVIQTSLGQNPARQSAIYAGLSSDILYADFLYKENEELIFVFLYRVAPNILGNELELRFWSRELSKCPFYLFENNYIHSYQLANFSFFQQTITHLPWPLSLQ